jgi:hypothetical protein
MKSRLFPLFLTAVLFSACNGTFQIGLEHPGTATPQPPAATARQSTPTLPPAAATQAATDQPAAMQNVEIFLIALEDNGQAGNKIGCGDSAVPVQVVIPATQGVLKASLQALLALKDQYYGESGLYNALYQSDLQVASVSLENRTAVVQLTGSLLMGGECDAPRVAAQLEETALQFPSVTQVQIFINDKPLSEALSLRGEG